MAHGQNGFRRLVAMRLLRAALVILAMTAIRLAIADGVRLPSQSHREVWNDSAGEAMKDFEWTYVPVLATPSGALDVRVEIRLDKHADGFAGVTREIEFWRGPDHTLELTFDDGTTRTAGEARAYLDADELGSHHLAKIRVSSELAGRTWHVDWPVSRPAVHKPAAASKMMRPGQRPDVPRPAP
jgi:hypothetical protein